MSRHRPDPTRFGIFILRSKFSGESFVVVHVDDLALYKDAGHEVLFSLPFTDTETNPMSMWWWQLILMAWREDEHTVETVRALIRWIYIRVTSGAIELPPEQVFRTHLSGATLRYCLNNLPEAEQMFHELERAFKSS